MERFIMMIKQDREQLNAMSDFDQQACSQLLLEWILELENAEKFRTGEKLGEEIRHVSNSGPFGNPTKVVSDYLIISAENFDQAVDLARECPLLQKAATIDIQQLFTFQNGKD
jgi:hypothetical protein